MRLCVGSGEGGSFLISRSKREKERKKKELDRKRGWGLYLKLFERVYNVFYILN